MSEASGVGSRSGRLAGNPAELAAMRHAVELAARGLGTTSPNPVVGCVILDVGGAVAGDGFHDHAGGPHAEIRALAAAGERARGGTAVVTLEPCDHIGRTGPCTKALIAAGVRRVVAAIADPNDRAGGGAAELRAAGIEVEFGLLADEAGRVNEAWLTRITLGRPHVTWKFAASLDGRVAAADGSSRWITGPAARADAHRLRAQSDAVVVGSGTLFADDPHLAARGLVHREDGDGGFPPRQPLRVVVDTEARIRPGARVLDAAAPTVVAVAEDADTRHLDLSRRGSAAASGRAAVEVLRLPRETSGGLSLVALLDGLRARGVVSVLLEGGPTLAGSFLQDGLVDKVIAYLSPALIGDAGRSAVSGLLTATIADVLRLRIDDVAQIGSDLRVTARPVGRDTAGTAAPGTAGRVHDAGSPAAVGA